MSRHPQALSDWLAKMPVVAILRGVPPERAAEYGFALADAGISIIEVPLNGARALESIGALAGALGRFVLVGAGTVLSADDVVRARDAGAQLIVSPNASSAVISSTKQRDMFSVPGVCTASEAFAAMESGADALKLFPAEGSSPPALAALKTVLGPIPVLPVGGITPETMEGWWRAGASGFGIGSALFRPDYDLDEVRRRAAAFASTGRQLLAMRGQ